MTSSMAKQTPLSGAIHLSNRSAIVIEYQKIEAALSRARGLSQATVNSLADQFQYEVYYIYGSASKGHDKSPSHTKS